MNKTDTSTQTLIAANDNPGGATEIAIALSSFVTLMAKAYVTTKARKAEGRA